MSSLILRTASYVLEPLLLLFSLIVLLRGHNQPGGGFAGGLMAGAALALHAITFGVASARRALHVDPHFLIGSGLLVAAGSGILSLFAEKPFMTGQWTTLSLPGLAELDLGSPLLFDGGVYLVVVGVTSLVILSLAEE
ncbi:MAG: Na+/H+ antiporter subunit B [Acidobacteria bacterium]|nr:Na+/H+ antiporter subunit B [Acidobacteriota bacterium]